MIAKPEQFFVSHPTGNTFVRALLSELDQQNRLKKYFTSIGMSQESRFISKLLGKRRSYSLNSNKLSTQFFPEILRLLPFGARSQESKRKAVDSSYQSLDNRVSESLGMLKGGIIHAYEDGAELRPSQGTGCFFTHMNSRSHIGLRCVVCWRKKRNDYLSGNQPSRAHANPRKNWSAKILPEPSKFPR